MLKIGANRFKQPRRTALPTFDTLEDALTHARAEIARSSHPGKE